MFFICYLVQRLANSFQTTQKPMFDRGNRQYYVAVGGIPLLMKAFQTVAITEHPYEIRICQDCTHTFSSNLCKYTRWQDHGDSHFPTVMIPWEPEIPMSQSSFTFVKTITLAPSLFFLTKSPEEKFCLLPAWHSPVASVYMHPFT